MPSLSFSSALQLVAKWVFLVKDATERSKNGAKVEKWRENLNNDFAANLASLIFKVFVEGKN